jgi:hypothetical protein
MEIQTFRNIIVADIEKIAEMLQTAQKLAVSLSFELGVKKEFLRRLDHEEMK